MQAATKNLLLLSLLEEVKSVNHCWRYLDKAWVDLGRRGEVITFSWCQNGV
jgi:hypothetical protein